MSTYRKSSYSHANGNCVEAGAWRKASYSHNTIDCVEAGQAAGVVVRDTKEAGQEYRVVPEFPVASWREFTQALKEMPA
jgi:Domain of unknown function (DUF397)